MVTGSNPFGWPKRITVERKIVNLLSRSLYSDFPRAIREAVSNSYDADATIVKIEIDTEKSEIRIEDNGNGMSAEQFGRYLRIAGQKSEGGFSEKFARKRIGRFGVGFLACFPFCDNLEITSKREGSDTGFTANIPTKRFVEGAGIEEDVSSIPVDGYDEPHPGKTYEHYTKVKMSGLTKHINEYFKSRSDKKYITIESWNGMRRLKWQLCETLPLDYQNPNSEIASALGNEILGMEVWLNDERLYRNNPGTEQWVNGELYHNNIETSILSSSGGSIIRLGTLDFKFAIMTNWEILHPVEARGLKIRVNGVGVGSRTYFDIEKERRTFSRLNWLTGEIQIIQGLDESLAINRDNFIWSPEYESLKEYFQNILLRDHSKVESIAVVDREMSDLVANKNNMPSSSMKALIDDSIKILDSSGFHIVHKQGLEATNWEYIPPIGIDKKNNIAYVFDDYPMTGETVEVQQHGMKIRYKAFNKANRDTEPLRVAEDGTIELNTSYPIFSGKTKGDILKKVHLLLFLAKRDSNNVEEMYNKLVELMRNEFE